MYIRIEFENLESTETQNTMMDFGGSPSGTCLSSTNGWSLTTSAVQAANPALYFWHLDEEILNKHYGGMESALNHLRGYAGVRSITVLPFDRPYDHSAVYELRKLMLNFV